MLTQSLGGLGSALGVVIAIAMLLCSTSALTSSGRMLFAFARDDGTPAAAWLSRVNYRTRTPANANVAISLTAWLLVAFAFLAGGTAAIAIVTAISTIALYLAYGIPILLGLRSTPAPPVASDAPDSPDNTDAPIPPGPCAALLQPGFHNDRSWRSEAAWNLGCLSAPFALISVLWIAFISVLFIWPTSGNPATWYALLIFLAILALYYVLVARRSFTGPRARSEAELTAIEASYDH